MSNIVSRNVDDLPEASKQSLEQLLGAPLKPHERIYILVESPLAGPAQSVRVQAAKRIREIVALARANADAQQVSDDDFGSAVDEATQQIRPRT